VALPGTGLVAVAGVISGAVPLAGLIFLVLTALLLPLIWAALPLAQRRVVAKWDAAAQAGERLVALAEWPPGHAAWRGLVERQAEEALSRRDWRRHWGQASLRPAGLGLALWIMAVVWPAAVPTGGASAGDEVALAAVVDPAVAPPEPADPAAVPAVEWAAETLEAEVAAALLALQEEADRLQAEQAQGRRWEEVAAAMADALRQWEGAGLDEAAQAAEQAKWDELAEALARAAREGAGETGMPGADTGSGGRRARPQAGAEGAAEATAQRLAAALREAGDEAGAAAAAALAQASQAGGEGAAQALQQLGRSAQQGGEQVAAGEAAGAMAGMSEALRQALADLAGSGLPGDESPQSTDTPAPVAGVDPGGVGDPVADLAVQLLAQLQTGAATGGAAEQRTVAAGLADLLQARSISREQLAEQAASRAPGEPETVPGRHRLAVERYFEGRRQAASTVPPGGGR